MIDPIAFPRLTPRNFRVTSPESADYNCVAWAAGDTEHWWQPGDFWPAPSTPERAGIAELEAALATIGYSPADNEALEVGFEKVALFAIGPFYTHAARQLSTGRWTSKLGRAEDVEHETPNDLSGGVYGQVVSFMKRPIIGA